jgi:hypothetical protein
MASVKSPFSGTATSVCCYCEDAYFPDCPPDGPVNCWSQCSTGDCHHPYTQSGSSWPGPVDIGAAQGTPVYFRATNDVASIRVESCDICSPPVPGSADNWGVIVHMYSGRDATGTHLGAVVYGHVANRWWLFQPGQVANRDLYGNEWQYAQIGTVPPAEGDCSFGPHVHMECQGGSVQLSTCNQNLSQGANVVYTF